MSVDVVCLRPQADFTRVGVTPPASLRIVYRAPEDAELRALLKEARAVVIPAVGPKLAPDLFEDSAVKLVQVTGAGVDRLDAAAMQRHGITVANVPGGSNSAVAEYAVTTASLLLRRFAWADAEIRTGNYAAFRARMVADNLRGLEGLLVGVVGFGTIGGAVAQGFAKAGCRLCYHDPVPAPDAAAELNAELLPLEALLARADVVSLHVPLVEATRGLIGAAELALMQREAVLIQASRGGIVDEEALAQRLASGALAGAAVDVYDSEPPGADSPLLSLTGEGARRLLLTPHIAGVTQQSWATLFRTAWDNVERVLLRGEPAQHRIQWKQA